MPTDTRLTATADIERMVQLVNPDWTLRDDTAESSGRHFTHRLRVDTGAGETRVILKASKDDDSYCQEARLLAVLDGAKELPVASLHGVVDQHDDLPTPFFVMDELPGVSIHKSETDTLSKETLRQIAVSSGHQLAKLHQLNPIDEFGVISVSEGESLHGGTPTSDPAMLSVTGGEASWAGHMEDSFDALLEALADSQFGCISAEVSAAANSGVDGLRADDSFDPVVGRVEHSLDNILVDRDAGLVTGMLDWEFVASMTAANDLVFAGFWLSGGQWGLLPSTPDYRDVVREGLLEGYQHTGKTGVLAEYRVHHECYEILQLLRTMVHFDGMFDAYGASEQQRQGAALALRNRISEVVK